MKGWVNYSRKKQKGTRITLGNDFFLCFIFSSPNCYKPTISLFELLFFTAEDDADDEIRSAESLQFHFDTIRGATNNFSDANKLGQGGFGAVYKVR